MDSFKMEKITTRKQFTELSNTWFNKSFSWDEKGRLFNYQGQLVAKVRYDNTQNLFIASRFERCNIADLGFYKDEMSAREAIKYSLVHNQKVFDYGVL